MTLSEIRNHISNLDVLYLDGSQAYQVGQIQVTISGSIRCGSQAIILSPGEVSQVLELVREKFIQGAKAAIISGEMMSWLRSCPYISGYEIKDLMQDYTSLEVLLDPEDYESFLATME